MSNPTIFVNLSSIKPGTVPKVTSPVKAYQGKELDVNVIWPSSASNKISCDLDFSASKNQNPFNDTKGGDTSFGMKRTLSTDAAIHTLVVQKDAKTTSDTYVLNLTIDGQTYTEDPIIIVDIDPD